MRNLEKILILFVGVTALFFLEISFAKSVDPQAILNGHAQDEAKTTLEEIAFEAYDVKNLEDLEKKMKKIKQAMDDLILDKDIVNGPQGGATHLTSFEVFLNDAKSFYDEQKELFKKAVGCCGNPDSCKSTIEVVVEEAAPWIGVAAGLGLDILSGGGAQCVQSLTQIGQTLGGFMGVSKACEILHSGGTIEGKTVIGAVNLAKGLKEVLKAAKLKDLPANSSAALVAKQQSLKKIQTDFIQDMDKSINQVSNLLKKGQVQAKALSDSLLQSAVPATSCVLKLVRLLDEDGTNTNTNSIAAVNCINLNDVAANPGICRGYGGSAFNKDIGFQKIATADIGSDGSPGLYKNSPKVDPLDLSDKEEKHTAPSPSSSGPTAAASTSPGGFGAGGSNGGNQEKTTGGSGNRKTAGKEGKLFNGYRRNRSAGGSSFNRFKGFNSGLNMSGKTEEQKKNALVALDRLIKARVSPDQAGSIFERVSNRFKTSIVKENLFDCKGNKESWMENLK